MKGLKSFCLGILWALLSPLLLIAIALVALFNVFNFIGQFFVMVFNFFRGKKLFPPFPEDEKAYQILKKSLDEQNAEQPQPQPVQAPPQQVYVQQNYYTQPGMVPPHLQNPNMLGNPYGQQGPYPGLPPQNPYGAPPQIGYPNPPQQPPYPDPNQPARPPLAEIPPYDRLKSISIFDDEEDDL